MSEDTYDALILVSFGGPDRKEDVMPFLRNVVRGRGVPDERLLSVAEHYYHFGGKSPINDQNRELLSEVKRELTTREVALPWYWGNRNWHPMLEDTLRQMAEDGVRRALAFVTSAYSSYSGCRQYQENIERARVAVGPSAPTIDKIRPYHNHPRFIQAAVDYVSQAASRLGLPKDQIQVLFTAHSIPTVMSNQCDYVEQLLDTCKLVAGGAGLPHQRLVYQSRSGPPRVPWLEPDILDVIKEAADAGQRAVLVAPVGFVSDHLEVLWDLDTEARELAEQLNLRFERAATVGTHPQFWQMAADLIEERLRGAPVQALGELGPRPHQCRPGCCPSGRPARPAASGRPAS